MRFRFTIKVAIAGCAWTVAILLAIARTIYGDTTFDVWAILVAALAALTSATVVLDYVIAEASHRLMRKIADERAVTVRRAVKAMREDNQMLADKMVQRLASKQDKTVALVAAEIAIAMRDELAVPTPIR